MPSSRSSRASSTGDGDDENADRRHYLNQIATMKDYETTTLYLDFAHLVSQEAVLARAIADQYYRWGWV